MRLLLNIAPARACVTTISPAEVTPAICIDMSVPAVSAIKAVMAAFRSATLNLFARFTPMTLRPTVNVSPLLALRVICSPRLSDVAKKFLAAAVSARLPKLAMACPVSASNLASRSDEYTKLPLAS